MDAHKWHREKKNLFKGKLVNEEGLTPDYAREAAEEAGYLPAGSDLAAFYDALDADLRGEGITEPTTEQVEDINRAQMEAEAEDLGITGFENMTNAQLESELQAAHVPEWLYSFPGPIAEQWRQYVADPLIDFLAEGTYSPFARFLGGYPFKDLAMGKLPHRSSYLVRRGIAQGQIYRVNQAAKRLSDKLRKASTEDRKAAYDYLTTAGADPKALPDSIRGPAVAAKSSIKKLGQ